MMNLIEYVFIDYIKKSNPSELNSFEVLWIYFSNKPQSDKERILRDATFGC